MNQKIMRIIYIYHNRVNNKIYVGQTFDLNKRINGHKSETFSRLRNHPFYNAIRKYNLNNFDIVELENIEDNCADDREAFYIQYFKSYDRNYGYNIELGGCKNKIISEETKKKISDANVGKCYNTLEHMEKLHKMTGDRLRGTHLSQKIKKKISESRMGFKHTEKTKQKMSETRVKGGTFAGNKNPNFGKTGNLNPATKLNWEIINNIRLDYSLGLKGKKLMKKYNISETNMYRILKNEIWKV